MQIITGLILSMHYVADWEYAFASVEHIMRDVNYGCFVRYLHANGASMFFFVVYIHIFKNLYYGSFMYPRRWVWITGVFIFILMILTAFTGYVLPWGQMSFWAATVITNLCSAIPYIGVDLVEWIWGGYSVDNPTLKRFYTIHFLMPFIILALAMLHITLLHHWGSNSPLGIGAKLDNRRFTPYFFVKDFSFTFFFALFAGYFIFFMPNVLGHPDNYIPANPLVTPEHIVPEWYFLPFYAILRALPDKLLGVCALGLSLIVLLFLPFYDRASVRSFYFKPISKIFFWWFTVICILLMWTGAKPIESPFLLIGQVSTFGYFFYLLIIIPFFSELHLIFNKVRLYHPINLSMTSKNFFFKSLNWFFIILNKSSSSVFFFQSVGSIKIKEELLNSNSNLMKYKHYFNNSQIPVLGASVDLVVLKGLENLKPTNFVESMVLNTPSLVENINEYKQWSAVIAYMGYFLPNNTSNNIITFLSESLDSDLTDNEYTFLERENIDINYYKISKHYNFYQNSVNKAFLNDLNESWLKKYSNISLFFVEEAQFIFFGSTVNNIFDWFIKN